MGDDGRLLREPGPAQRRFCAELRSWRELRRVSQAMLAVQVQYSREWVTKVEQGARWPTEHLARRADAVLDTGGALLAHWPAVHGEWCAANAPQGPQPLAAVLPLFPPRTPATPPDTAEPLVTLLVSLLREVPGARVVVVSADADLNAPAAAGDDVEHSAVVDLARFRTGTARRRADGERR